MRRTRWRVAAAVLALCSAPGTWAQAKPRPEARKKPDARTPGNAKDDEKQREETRVLQLQELEVQGTVQKPSVLSIIPPPSTILGEAERHDSYIPKIMKAVEAAPF
jgi:hypothetical protein